MITSLFIQNIISPYRSHFFNSLTEQDSSFATFYMATTASDRNWDVSKISMKHKFWVDKYGLCFVLKGIHIHINPILILRTIFSRRIRNIILCVGYDDLSIIALIVAKRLHFTNKRIFFWAEANYLTNGARKDFVLKSKLRRWVFSAVDGAMIIPGHMSEITFEKWGIPVKNFIYLPNTINDAALKYNAQNRRAQNELPVFLMPIRIIESLKGALNFFDSIGEKNVREAKFIIAGDGEDKDKYQEYIDKHNYQDNIELAGFCEAADMRELYNSANVLLLPSFSDPSPLALVEALLFHLPVLCSEHCGNHFEVVDYGVNGYTFSPLDKVDIKDKFETLMSRRAEWAVMGEESAKRYAERFETKKVVADFINQYNRFKK
jgi:glycosyltransferase involved in cell wall biosynthesis